jgi:hypothetical protein
MFAPPNGYNEFCCAPGSNFGQPKAGPQGGVQGWTPQAQQNRRSPRIIRIREEFFPGSGTILSDPVFARAENRFDIGRKDNLQNHFIIFC